MKGFIHLKVRVEEVSQERYSLGSDLRKEHQRFLDSHYGQAEIRCLRDFKCRYFQGVPLRRSAGLRNAGRGDERGKQDLLHKRKGLQSLKGSIKERIMVKYEFVKN